MPQYVFINTYAYENNFLIYNALKMFFQKDYYFSELVSAYVQNCGEN